MMCLDSQEITHELARWHMPVIPTDWRLRQGDCKFKVGLDNIEILSQKENKEAR